MSNRAMVKAMIKWEGRTIRLSYDPLSCTLIDHLVIMVDDNMPIPITQTGYKSHFFGPCEPALTEEDIVALVHDWIEAEAKSKDWITAEEDRRQGTLF